MESKNIMYVLIAIAIMGMLFYMSRQETMVSKGKGKVRKVSKAEFERLKSKAVVAMKKKTTA